MKTELRCFFCGQKLRPAKTAGRFTCGKCGAGFRAEKDPGGCVLRLEVIGCGAEECCRKRKSC